MYKISWCGDHESIMWPGQEVNLQTDVSPVSKNFCILCYISFKMFQPWFSRKVIKYIQQTVQQ